MYCAQCASGITFIRYAQNRNISVPNNIKLCGSNISNGLNMMAKSGYVAYDFENFKIISFATVTWFPIRHSQMTLNISTCGNDGL